MSVDEIEKAFNTLSAKDRARLLARLEEIAADEWDRQIERDAKNGKLDKLIEESEEDFRTGKCREI